MQATGMDLEQLFAHLSDALLADKEDRFPAPVLFNGRMPELERVLVQRILGRLVDHLSSQTARILDQAHAVRLMEVNGHDDTACIEIIPAAVEHPGPVAGHTGDQRPPKLVVRRKT